MLNPLAEVPKKPKVYCTGNSKKIIQKYKDKMVNDKLYGVVGPIVGISGLLVGLAKRNKIDAISFLSETYGHPMYLGIKGSIEILKVLDKKFGFNIRMTRLNKEIRDWIWSYGKDWAVQRSCQADSFKEAEK